MENFASSYVKNKRASVPNLMPITLIIHLKALILI